MRAVGTSLALYFLKAATITFPLAVMFTYTIVIAVLLPCKTHPWYSLPL